MKIEMYMKIILPFLSLLAYSFAEEQVILTQEERSLSGSLISALEGLREQMPCGFPDLGIPPLAPLSFYKQNVTFNQTGIALDGFVSDFTLNGLNDFEIKSVKVNIVTSKISFSVLFNNINLNTMYKLKATLNTFGLNLNVQGEGSAKYAVVNIAIWGSVKYSLNIISGKMGVTKLDVHVKIGRAESDIKGIVGEGIFNEKLNEILAELVPDLVNDNEEIITKTIQDFGLPLINKQLANTTLNDLIGGSGGDEKPKCDPNEIH